MERIEDYDFGLRLKELRKRKNYTQKQLAAMLGVGAQTVYKYESNLLVPSIERLTRMAVVLDTSVDYLMGREKARALYIDGISDDDMRCLLYIANMMKNKGYKDKGKQGSNGFPGNGDEFPR